MTKIYYKLRALLALCALILLFSTASSSSSAQTLCDATFEWAQRAGGSATDYGYSIAVDGEGNSYIIGNFTGTSTFGGTTISSPTQQFEVYVAKLDKDGNFLWARSAGGAQNDYGKSIAVDKQGNSYITGYFSGSATFGDFTINSYGSIDIFIAKLDIDGSFLWALNAGGTSRDEGWGLDVDADANIYVTGRFIGTSTFGDITINSASPGSYDVFVAKLNKDGNFLWVKSAGGTSGDEGHSIAVDKNRNSYVTGNFSGTATFGSTTLTSTGSDDIFVSKLDEHGDFIWAVQGGGTLSDYANGISVDGVGNSYIIGYYNGTATFGNTSFTSSGNNDAFIAKVNSSGAFEWAKSVGSSENDYGRSIASDGAGNSFVIGEFAGTISLDDFSLSSAASGIDIFIARLDTDGNYNWAVKAGGLVSDYGQSVATNGDGNAYIAGYFSGIAFFGDYTLTSAGVSDIFVAKITDDCPEIPTPIVLIEFQAAYNGTNTVLAWATASESNNSGFEIEHSNDGVNWQSVGFVNSLAPEGNSNERINYYYEDRSPHAGLHYYRLLQRDMDGRTTYSEVRAVTIEQKVSVVAAPNPTKDLVTVRGLIGDETISVYAFDGKLLETLRAQGATQRISMGKYVSGIYILRISREQHQVATIKVVKN